MTERAKPISAFKINNVRRFIAFRVFFNSRFYYPIFTILFLDFGLTLSQFALLNAVWAASIVLLEVPSGALADIIGRRKLMIVAGLLMVIEMLILSFAPRGNVDLLFAFFLVNRILSGAAEAAASGADEAIAYDALKEEGDPADWDLVLARAMRLRYLAGILALSVGAAVYDPALLQALADFIGWDMTFNQDITLRFPLYLTLLMSLGALYNVFKLNEAGSEENDADQAGWLQTGLRAFRLTFRAGRWILKTPFALMIIMFGLVFDHVLRMLLTMNSQYLRLIELPEATFGLIGSARSLVGVFVPALAMLMVRRLSPRNNVLLTGAAALAGFYGMTFFWPYWGLAPLFLLAVAGTAVGFFVSYYLNHVTDSSRRATVLSFKGLSFNLAYGLIGVLYSLLLAYLHGRLDQSVDSASASDLVFIKSVAWFPGYFLVVFGLTLLFGAFILRRTDEHKRAGHVGDQESNHQ